MITLVWFLIAWIACVGIFLLASTITVALALRFGLSGSKTFVLCLAYLLVGFVVIGTVGTYALGVDWSQTISAFSLQLGSNGLSQY